MALKIFQNADNEQTPGNKFADDIVGSLRTPTPTDDDGNWRITSDDPQVIDDMTSLYGGTSYTLTTPTGEKAKEEFGLVLPESSIAVEIEGIRGDEPWQRGLLVEWNNLENGRFGKVVARSDGFTITYDDGETEADPDAELSLKDRFDKSARRGGMCLDLRTVVRFADAPEAGKFRFNKRTSAKDGKMTGVSVFYGLNLGRSGSVEAKYEKAAADGASVPATLKLKSNEGKSGTYYVPEIIIK